MARNGVVVTATSASLSAGDADAGLQNGHGSSIKRASWLWPYLVPTVTKTGLPQVFHEPHVETGFRQVHQPWSYYMFSIFQVHNECLNVWTHLVALVAMVFRFYEFSSEFDMLNDPYMWPLGTYFMSTFLLYVFSSGAHCFCSRSEFVHYTCFLMDYAGIGLQGLGSTIAHYWYCMHEDIFDTFPHRFAAPVGVLLSSMVCLCCSTAKVYYVRPYPFTKRLWQIGSCMAIYSWLILPVMYQVYLHLLHSYWEPSLADHMQQVLWFMCGGFFFSSDIPQRFFPGRFDFVGHSHQMFHVCIMMTTLKQLDAIYKDIIADKENLYASQPPTFWGTYGAAVVGLVINVGLVLLFQRVIKGKMAKEKKE